MDNDIQEEYIGTPHVTKFRRRIDNKKHSVLIISIERPDADLRDAVYKMLESSEFIVPETGEIPVRILG